MPSPFPGMNPYLEREVVWHDFHEAFIPSTREAIAAQLDPAYVVKIDERVYVQELTADERVFLGRGDATVARGALADGGGDVRSEAESSAAVLDAPAEVRLPRVDWEHISFVEIRDRESWEIITVIELLSPANKRPGPDRDAYLSKRAELLASRAHFIELDLLRGGPRMPLEGLPECAYYALVSRAQDRPRAGVWPIGLRDRLPLLPIPLRAPDPDARLDLQAVLHRVYEAARYERYIYRSLPTPPLAPDDAAWAATLAKNG